MYGPKKLAPEEVAEEAGVTEDQAVNVLDFLIDNGWMLGRYVDFN